MKITKIEYIKTIRPNCSSGTGYSEPNIFLISNDDGLTERVCIDIWYTSEKYYINIFEKSINDVFRNKYKQYSGIENFSDAFKMWYDLIDVCNKTEYDIYYKKYKWLLEQ